MSDWQPIKSAPKDGTTILIYGSSPPSMALVYWQKGFRWCSPEDGLTAHIVHNRPTHWMPLPAKPTG